jgi:hypothetical protein
MSSEIFGASAKPNVTENPRPHTTIRIGIHGTSFRGGMDVGTATDDSTWGPAGCGAAAGRESAAGSLNFSAVARREEIATTLLRGGGAEGKGADRGAPGRASGA